MPSYLSPGVYVEEVPSGTKPIEGVGTAVCAFVGFTEKGPSNEPTLVTNWTQYTSNFGGFIEGALLPHAVYGYFLNGGGAAYVVRVGEPAGTAIASGNGAGAAKGEIAAPPAVELSTGGEAPRPAFRVRAIEGATADGDIAVEVSDASEPAGDTFKLVVLKAGKVAETFDNVTTKRGTSNVVTAVRQRSKLITVEEARPAPLAVPEKGVRIALSGGDGDGDLPVAPAAPAIQPDHYVGDAGARTGFAGLEAFDDVTMLSVPDLMSAYQTGTLDGDGLKAVQLAMIAHCELMGDRVAILDAPPGLSPQRIKEWRVDVSGYDSKYATLYWPWIKIMDPVTGKPIMMPPSGHVAGVWARNDDTRGVHKAPANEVLRGVIDLESGLTRIEHGQLNPVGVNCIRSFPGQGIRIWGARTLSSDPEWRYLNVRRLFNFIEKSILNGTNWAVFEPNDFRLWGTMERAINMFLRRVWRSGALFGASPEQAFFVRCNEENNPPENRDVGILTVDVGIAPVKPAEFIVFRLSQFSDGAGLEE
ncbi:MAG TPA: phage tail sheath subtilisin-like domain-containing protein [Streptosporangiaceae bacterium]|nr:phage tail sheath subtilisin-like domain-containing protein [Streptosporangiaceae bacterium]